MKKLISLAVIFILLITSGCRVSENRNSETIKNTERHSFVIPENIHIEKSIDCGKVLKDYSRRNKYAFTVDSKFIFAELSSASGELNIRCIDLTSLNELWRFGIKKESQVDNLEYNTKVALIDNLLYVYSGHNYGEKFVPYLYILDENGKLLEEEKLPFSTYMPDRDMVISVEQDIVSNPNVKNAFIKGYSLKEHKILFDEEIKVGPLISTIFDDALYLFSVNGNSLRIHKIDKFNGKILSVKDFPEIKNFQESEQKDLFLADPLAIENGLTFFSPDKRNIYCVDLKSMAVLYGFDSGIYITHAVVKDGLLFATGSGKSIAIEINSGKIIGKYNAEFDDSSVAIYKGNVYIGVSGEKIHAFTSNGKEIAFLNSPDMFGGSFIDLEVADDILIVHAIKRDKYGEAVHYLFVFNLKDNKLIFTLEGVDNFYIARSFLVIVPAEEIKMIFISLEKLK